jgi:hypothetical protein
MMSRPADRNELTLMLARAFDEAWELYYLPHRGGALSENIARSLLAKHLVALAKRGLTDEDALAVAGVERLISLTPAVKQPKVVRSEDDVRPQSAGQFEGATLQPETLHSQLDDARASFVPGWRIPSRRLG